MTSEALIIVKDYEREKIYRLVRRQDALINLLNTIDNTEITLSENKDDFKQKIEKDIVECQNKQKLWWKVICKRYKLNENNIQKLKVSIHTGEIFKV